MDHQRVSKQTKDALYYTGKDDACRNKTRPGEHGMQRLQGPVRPLRRDYPLLVEWDSLVISENWSTIRHGGCILGRDMTIDRV